MWCCDGAATTSATWARHKCYNIRECKVGIRSADDDTFFVCTEMGSVDLIVVNNDTGRLHKVTLLDVLISPKFPFHIVSEIVLFEKKCKASESDGSWTFFRPSNGFLMHASQRLLKKSQGRVNEKLYFIDEAPSSGAASEARVVVTRATNSRGVLIATLSVLHYR